MLKPPQLLHSLNSSGLGRKPGSVRKDMLEGASMVTEGLDKLRREFNAYKETNSQLHQVTQLQLTAMTSTLATLTSKVNDMGDRLVNTQRAILVQSQELSLSRAITDMRSNMLSLQVNLLLKSDETKRCEMVTLLGSMEEEENKLKTELATTSRDFLNVVQGSSVGQLVSSAPAMPLPSRSMLVTPPGLCRSEESPAHEQPASIKKRRLDVMIHPNAQRQMADVVHDCRRPHEQLIVANDGILPEPSMMHASCPRLRMHIRCTFSGVFDTLRDLNVCHCSHIFSCRSSSSIMNPTFLLFMLFLLASLTQIAHASILPPSMLTLSIYALNANGLVQPVKLNDINSVIWARSPQVFILGETKTKSKL